MKKLSLVVLMLGAVLVSCSKRDNLHVFPEEPWMKDMNLPVPIQFSTGANLTKAAISPDEAGNFPEGYSFGIFGVNNTPDMYWYATAENGDFLWHDGNAPTAAEMITKAGGAVDFPEGKKHYYPIYSDKSFDFYGYYPFKSSDGQKYSAGTYTSKDGVSGFALKYNLGNEDILWAHAKGSTYDDVKGFNAKYIRKITADNVKEANLPRLNFAHMLAGIHFDAISGTNLDVENVCVDFLSIKNTYQTAHLMVASRPNPGAEGGENPKEGKFFDPSPDWVSFKNNDSQPWQYESYAGVTLSNGGESLGIYPKAAANGGSELGTLFILPSSYTPDSNRTDPLEVVIEVSAEGKSYKNQITLPYPEGGYQQGVMYTYRIIVHDISKVEVIVSLEGWKWFDWAQNEAGTVIPDTDMDIEAYD